MKIYVILRDESLLKMETQINELAESGYSLHTVYATVKHYQGTFPSVEHIAVMEKESK